MQTEIKKLPFYVVLLHRKKQEEISVVVSTDPESSLSAAMAKKSDPNIEIHNKPIRVKSKRMAYILRKVAFEILFDAERYGVKPTKWIPNVPFSNAVRLFCLLNERENILLEEELEQLKK